MNKKDS